MSLLTQGRYKATISSAGLTRKGSSNLLCFSAYFKGDEWKNDAREYESIDGDYGIIGDLYLERKPESGGGLMEKNIERLAHALDWDGDLSTLADVANGKRCKITVEEEVYQGKTRPKLQWINHIDDGEGNGGGFEVKNDAIVAKQAQSQHGAKIRALLGASKPAPARPAAPRTAPPASSAPAHTLDSVYAAFENMCAKELKGSHDVAPEERVIHSNWYMFLKATYGHEDSAAVTDWTKAANAIEGYRGEILPF